MASNKQSDTLRSAAVEFSPGSNHIWVVWVQGACLVCLLFLAWRCGWIQLLWLPAAQCAELCCCCPGANEHSKAEGVQLGPEPLSLTHRKPH